MGLKTTCEGCGRTVTGIVSGLVRVDGKYLCPTCITNPEATNEYFCASCHSYFAYPARKGNGWVEIVLYLFWIVPGIVYSIWRRTGNFKACPRCKSSNIISASAGTHVRCPDCKEPVLKNARKCRHCGCSLATQ